MRSRIIPSYRPNRCSQISKRSRASTWKNSRYSSTRRFAAKLVTSMSKLGVATSPPTTARPSGPNSRTASRSTSSPRTPATPWTAAAGREARLSVWRARGACRLSRPAWAAAESPARRATPAPRAPPVPAGPDTAGAAHPVHPPSGGRRAGGGRAAQVAGLGGDAVGLARKLAAGRPAEPPLRAAAPAGEPLKQEVLEAQPLATGRASDRGHHVSRTALRSAVSPPRPGALRQRRPRVAAGRARPARPTPRESGRSRAPP